VVVVADDEFRRSRAPLIDPHAADRINMPGVLGLAGAA